MVDISLWLCGKKDDDDEDENDSEKHPASGIKQPV